MSTIRLGAYCALLILMVRAEVQGEPILSANHMELVAGDKGDIVVSGVINGESTFGVTVLVAVMPRQGNTGFLIFTTSPPVDIVGKDDPWPNAGLLTVFDTHLTGSPRLNGAVNDNGIFLPAPVTFSGDMLHFPVSASVDATGIWDVSLVTNVGSSSWEGLETTLVAGTITVTESNEVPAVSTWGLVITGLLLLTSGMIVCMRRGLGTYAT